MIPVLYLNDHIFLLVDPPLRHCSAVKLMVSVFNTDPVLLVRINPIEYIPVLEESEPSALSADPELPRLYIPLPVEEPVPTAKAALVLLPPGINICQPARLLPFNLIYFP